MLKLCDILSDRFVYCFQFLRKRRIHTDHGKKNIVVLKIQIMEASSLVTFICWKIGCYICCMYALNVIVIELVINSGNGPGMGDIPVWYIGISLPLGRLGILLLIIV